MTAKELQYCINKYLELHPDRADYKLWDTYENSYSLELAFVRKFHEEEDAFGLDGEKLPDNHLFYWEENWLKEQHIK